MGTVGGSPRTTLNGAPDPIQDKITVRNDAAAELERLTRTASSKKEMDFTQTDC